jgi:hypothetical protein
MRACSTSDQRTLPRRTALLGEEPCPSASPLAFRDGGCAVERQQDADAGQ